MLAARTVVGPYEILSPLGALPPREARGDELHVGAPKVLFENHEAFFFDVTRDGKRFLVAENPDVGASLHLDVVVNWYSDVQRRVQEAKAP